MREMRKTTVVVNMQMGQHDCFHIALADAETAQLRPDFLLGFDLEPDGELEIGVPPRQRFQMGT